MNVTTKFRLSQAGQKNALLAGLNAASPQETELPLIDMDLMSDIAIGADGVPRYDGRDVYTRAAWTNQHQVYLDIVPETADAVILACRALHAAEQERADAAKAEADAVVAERQRKHAEAVEAARPALIADIERIEAMSDEELVALPGLISGDKDHCFLLGSGSRPCDEATGKRVEALSVRKLHAEKRIKEAANLAAIAQREREVEERGGYVFPVEGGMCGFREHGLWLNGQSKRWVGKFSDIRGIDSFLDSPKGEFVFDVRGLRVGDKIQGGGYDQNRKGRRSSESEWFGLVMSVDSAEIVVRMHPTRAKALAA